MNKTCLLFIIFVALLSCKKDNKQNTNIINGNYQYLSSIQAGKINGNGIKYVDIIPDDTLKTTPYNSEYSKEYDLDGNNTLDFKITHYRSTPFALGMTSSLLCITPGVGCSVCVTDFNKSLAYAVSYDQTIDSNGIWSDSTANLFSYYWSMSGTTNISGFWRYNDKYYIGVRLKTGENYFYGWIDVRCGDYTSFSSNIVTRYAITKPYF